MKQVTIKFLNYVERTLVVLFLAGLALFVTTRLFIGTLPDRSEINKRMLRSPTQTPTAHHPFKHSFGGHTYEIIPRYNYILYGLVVSTRDLASDWFNIDYWKDPYNVKDVCVIWGKNLSEGDYLKARFSSGLWTCHYSLPKDTIFYPEMFSNNHLLPADEDVGKALRRVRKGDQIAIKGYLVDYRSDEVEGRQTSTSRNDKGNHACEVIYVKQLKIVEDANPEWDTAYLVSKYVMGIAASLWLLAFILVPMPKRSKRIDKLWK